MSINTVYRAEWSVGPDEEQDTEQGEEDGLRNPLPCTEELYTCWATISRNMEGNSSRQPTSEGVIGHCIHPECQCSGWSVLIFAPLVTELVGSGSQSLEPVVGQSWPLHW